MREADAKVMFGEWLPDLPEFDNPGVVDIDNMLAEDGGYVPFTGFGTAYSDALASRPVGAFMGFDNTGIGGRVFAATATALQYKSNASATWNDVTPASWACSEYVRFEQYGDLVIATCIDQTAQYVDITGLPADFAPLASTGTAPRARQVGKIGQFILLGDTSNGLSGSGTNHLQWCGIDDPRDWSTPGTAAAIAVQAGEQFLPSELGAITGIVGGDQFGVVFQQYGLSRVTYEGGETVFAFDKIESGKGCYFPNSIVEHGGLWYYLSSEGFHATNGVNCIDIGEGKCNKYFLSDATKLNASAADRVYGAIDRDKKIIYWTYVRSGQSDPDRIIAYNIAANRFTKASVAAHVLFTGYLRNGKAGGFIYSLHGFNSSFAAANFNGNLAGNAIITTAEQELNPGRYTLLQGFKPLFDGLGAGANVTVALASRDDFSTGPTFGSEASITARTGFADFRAENRYHRARSTLSAAWTKLVGFEIQQVPTGAV